MARARVAPDKPDGFAPTSSWMEPQDVRLKMHQEVSKKLAHRQLPVHISVLIDGEISVHTVAHR